MELKSLNPQAVLAKLDLDARGLEAVKAAAHADNSIDAFTALLEYYRKKFPPATPSDAVDAPIEKADQICQHIFHFGVGPYEPVCYGDDIDWRWDPRGDIEWVAVMYRFYWADILAQAYDQTRDERYADAFVSLTTDWIAKHPLENHTQTHPVYTEWEGFAWLDIQTGCRASRICRAFISLVHAEAFTPQFLQLLLASLYDHQVKTKTLPARRAHNKATIEQLGFIDIAYYFSEFRESREWLTLGMARVGEDFLPQVTGDGVQREWSFGYHLMVLRMMVKVIGRMDDKNIPVPEHVRNRIRGMYDYVFWTATPELGAPMFGDAARLPVQSADRSTWQLYCVLAEATDVLGDPKYRARADFDRNQLPDQKSYAFKEAGMYVMRNDWGLDQIHMGLHCSPAPLSGHDQPDNGTFELYAYGRWLMPDTGFYTYGHDRDARLWHRQTNVHQTLTLDNADTETTGRHLLWHSDNDLTAVVVENDSYAGLVHRRTVWFVNHRFFVLLDEAMGDAAGTLAIHFQFAPGKVAFDADTLRAYTLFDDANVLIAAEDNAQWTLLQEQGWFACQYGHRTPRKALRFEHTDAAPTSFLTVVAPYRSTTPPIVSAVKNEGNIGDPRVKITVHAFDASCRIGRDLASQTAWCKPVPV